MVFFQKTTSNWKVLKIMKTIKRPAWYLKPPPEKHQKWDAEKRINIAILREEGTSPELLAKAYGTNKVVIYNQTRVGRCSLNGVCFRCRRPLKKKKPGKPELCNQCKEIIREYKRKYRKKAQKIDYCTACGSRKALPGHRYCKNCLSISYRRRIKKGICGVCGERPIAKNSFSMCYTCLKNNRMAKKRG